MSDLVVIVPSRGRPEAALTVARIFADTCTADTELVFAIDADDPKRSEYSPLKSNGPVDLFVGNNSSMVSALNYAAHLAAWWTPSYKRDWIKDPPPFAVGFMGDDHRPRTPGWDSAYLDALRELGTGIVYGDDLLQGENLPTQCAMTSDIIRGLGHMAPPTLTHLYVDDYWRDLGRAAGCLRYLPDVVIEHMHPRAGKSEWDDGYRRVNADEVYQADAAAYAEYGRTRFEADVKTVKALR